MKILKVMLLIVVILFTTCFSSDEEMFKSTQTELHEDVFEELTYDEIFTIASFETDVPVGIIAGIAYTESGFDEHAIGDGGMSLGMFQLNETYHAERVRMLGREYNPFNVMDAALITALLYKKNYKQTGDSRNAIACHKQGLKGVKRNGQIKWYVNRVLRFADKYREKGSYDDEI